LLEQKKAPRRCTCRFFQHYKIHNHTQHTITKQNKPKPKQYKWVTFRIDDSGKTVIPDLLGGKTATYDDFVASLAPNDCRYGVYDYEYASPERGTFSKIVFINWAPDDAPVKTKMMYAATKDFFKGFLDGAGAELQASDFDEVSEEEVRARVITSLTRK
jgi:cofilin